VNLFQYVDNSPTSKRDPLGLIEAGVQANPNAYRRQWLPSDCFQTGELNLSGSFPDWFGFNSDSDDAVWWGVFWERWNAFRESEGPVILGTSGGPFSIVDWSGYPDNKPPNGPFRMLDGEEYERARNAADSENRRMHWADSSLDGKEIHERHPAKFGGHPTDPKNKMPLTKQQHKQYTRFWNRMMRSLRK